MPPQSRRQRKYETELQKLQARNRTAMILGLITVGVAGWLIWYVWLGNKPEIFLSVNQVQHTGARKIPFSEGSCDRVIEGFSKSVLGNPAVEKQTIDAQESSINIPEGMDQGDSFVVYFQGHFVDADSRPSELANPNTNATDNEDVYWIAPENDNFERSIEALLRQIQQSPAGLKIVLLDAGRYSWSPTYPGRPMNRFASALDDYLKKNELELDDNFWVVLSHSDLEISNTSTPLGCSLFAHAISESLDEFHQQETPVLDVRKWFADVHQRVRAYSRDFNSRSIQHPVLFQAGSGIVDVESVSLDDVDGEDISKMKFTWKQRESEPETPAPPQSYDWEIFQRKDNGTTGDVDRFVEELLKPENLTALPYETTRAVEDFLERSNQSIVDDWEKETQDRFRKYFGAVNQKLVQPADRNLQFDKASLQAKYEQINGFRGRLFEYLLWVRFRHQMRMLGDGTRSTIQRTKDAPDRVQISDLLLQSSDSAVDDRRNGVDQWDIDNLKRRNRPLFNNVDDGMKNESLTPMQAEMIGILSQRYLPLLKATLKSLDELEVSPEADAPPPLGQDAASKSFKLNLNDGKVARPEAEYLADLIKDAQSETAHLDEATSQEKAASWSDTDFRLYLISKGTDLTGPKTATVPGIDWRPLQRSIAFQGNTPGEQYVIPTNSTRRLPFKVTTTGIDAVDLSIAPLTDDSQFLNSVEFGFNRQFDKGHSVRDMTAGEKLFEKVGNVALFFRCRNPEEALIGPNYSFEITAKQWASDAQVEPQVKKFLVSISLAANAKPELKIKRLLGNPFDTDSTNPLGQFSSSFQATDWKPVSLRTLANVKAGFQFKLRNNIESERKFEIRLYRILRIPSGMAPERFRSDRVSDTSAQDYIQSLAKRTQTVGKQVFENEKDFELLASANLNAVPGKEETIPLAIPVPAKDPQDPSAKPAKPAASGDGPPVYDAEYPLLMVFFTEDEFRDPEEPLSPDWFQLLTFQIDYPGVPTPKISEYLQMVFEEDLPALPDLLVPESMQKVSAQMTRVTKRSYLENFHSVQRMGIDEMLQDSEISTQSDEDALLLMDLLGVPNYLAYSAAAGNSRNTLSRFRLTGVRITQPPKGWKIYPKTWSFATDRIDDPSFNWLANSVDEPNRIFIVPSEGDGSNTEIEVEMLLPTFEEDLLGSRPNDFWSKHQGRFTHFYPNARQHQIVIAENGIQAWTLVSAHKRKIGNFNRELVIGRDGNGDPALGRWIFQLESLKRDPKIAGVPEQIELIDTAFQNNSIVFDFSPIVPPVRPKDCAIYWDTTKLDKKKTGQLLSEDREFETGKYRVRLEDLIKVVGVSIPELEKQKAGQRVKLEIEATDFFGHVSNDQTELRLVKPRNMNLNPPKQKTGKLVIELVDSAGKPASISWLGPQNREMTNPANALKLNGQAIAIDDPTSVAGSLVKVSRSGSTIQLTNVPQGSYAVEVYAWIKPSGQAQKERSKGTAKTRVGDGENKVQLKLEYWDGS